MSAVHSMKLKCQYGPCTNPLPPKQEKFCGNRCRVDYHNALQRSIRLEARQKRQAIRDEMRAKGLIRTKPPVKKKHEYMFGPRRQVFHVKHTDITIPTQREGFKWLYSQSQ